MSALFDLLEQEREPAVRAVLDHWLFGNVHAMYAKSSNVRPY